MMKGWYTLHAVADGFDGENIASLIKIKIKKRYVRLKPGVENACSVKLHAEQLRNYEGRCLNVRTVWVAAYSCDTYKRS